MEPRNNAKPYLYLFLAPLIWSTNFVIARHLVQQISPLLLTTIRIFVASVLLTLLLKLNKDKAKITYRDFLFLAIMGFFGNFVFNISLYMGLSYTSAINGAIINTLLPTLTIILAVPLLKERLTPRLGGGVVLSFVGAILIASKGELFAWHLKSLNLGELMIFLGTFGWAIYTVAGKYALARLTPLQTTAYSTFLGLVFLFPFGVWEVYQSGFPAISVGVGAALIYLGVFPPVVATFCWNRGVQEIGASRSGLFYNLLPVYAGILATLFLGEQIRWYHWFSSAMVFGGVFLGAGGTGTFSPEKNRDAKGAKKAKTKNRHEGSDPGC